MRQFVLALAVLGLGVLSCNAPSPEPASTAYTGAPPPLVTLTSSPVPTSDPPGLEVLTSESQLPARDQYRQFDFDADPWLSGFNTEYQTAAESGEAWVQNPVFVALRVSGYPNADGGEPTKVSVFYPTSERAIVIVLTDPVVGDDSVAAVENRVDLVKSGTRWEVEWAGGRYRCQPGRGQQDFAPELCA